MSQESVFLRFFWGPRRETTEAAADRLLRYLAGLSDFDPVYSSWYPIGKDPDDPRSKPVALAQEALVQLCRRGVSREEVPPFRPMEGLGFRVSLGTGGSWRLVLRVGCGGFTPYVQNSLIMDLPITGTIGKRVCRADRLIDLCRLVVACYDPDVGQVWSSRMGEEIAPTRDDLDVGWLTYVADRRPAPDAFDRTIEVIPIEGFGRLIVATRQRFSTGNPHHLKRVRLIAETFDSQCPPRSLPGRAQAP